MPKKKKMKDSNYKTYLIQLSLEIVETNLRSKYICFKIQRLTLKHIVFCAM